MFGGKLAQTQVDGINALLEACSDLSVADDRHVAYILATPMIESGGTFVPITASLNYSSTALMSKFGERITSAAEPEKPPICLRIESTTERDHFLNSETN